MTEKLTLVVATTNPGKLEELHELLAGLAVELLSLADFPGMPEVSEDGATYFENARKKALAVARWTALPALADDSGLEVDALAGAPGVHSARYAGASQDSAANTRKLLQMLRGVAAERRRARFRCVIVVACPDGRELACDASCDGRIIDAARGAQGFGYDPVFFYEPARRTFAEMSSAEKQKVSHRGRACAALRPQLEEFLRTCAARLNP